MCVRMCNLISLQGEDMKAALQYQSTNGIQELVDRLRVSYKFTIIYAIYATNNYAKLCFRPCKTKFTPLRGPTGSW